MHLDASWALRVDRKGASKEVVKWCCDKLEDSGYNGIRISINTDQEPSIVDLGKAISVERIGENIVHQRQFPVYYFLMAKILIFCLCYTSLAVTLPAAAIT